MRRFLQGTFGTLFVLLAVACSVFLFVLLRAPAFEKGESYTFYMGANSSALAISSDFPAFDKLRLGEVKGESVQYAGNRLDELKTKYRAKLLFTEEACGIINYYFYSPVLKSGVLLNGQPVNLHIAVSAEKTVAGTPLIFGGF